MTAYTDALAARVQRAARTVVGVTAVRTVRAPPGSPLWHMLQSHANTPLPEVTLERRFTTRGSGVLLAPRGAVLTTFRLVRQADMISVTVADGRRLRARLVGVDPASDVALLRLRGDTSTLPVARVGDAQRLRFGVLVFALGHSPSDGLHASMGIIAARGAFSHTAPEYDDLIRADVALRRGAAGGALINAAGEVVGINTAQLRLGGGGKVSLSLPANVFAPIVKRLAAAGSLRPGWLGVSLQAPDPAVRKPLGGWPYVGAQVRSVVAGSPAARAGLRAGDIVLTVDGHAAGGNSWLRARMIARGPGETITLSFARRNCDAAAARLASLVPRAPSPPEEPSRALECTLAPHKISVRLASPPPPPHGIAHLALSEGPLGGVTLAQAPARIDGKTDASSSQGVALRIERVVPLSPAASRQLAVGDIIVARDGAPIASLERFIARYRREPGPLVLTVMRGRRVRLLIGVQ
ncbi:MAG: trypsin-like peptidase domain-containing protein [Myxococcales bacterium]|nr:trypsin-like peptidase domain-containing protein [Myxococcales bacterium]